jgi:excisionase family DNA binding protein
MALPIPSGVLLTDAECARLDHVLMRALRDAHMRDGGAPQWLLDVAADIHQRAGEFRKTALVSLGSGTVVDESGSGSGSWVGTEQLTVQQAANLTGASDSYLRRMARRGDVQASRSGVRGEWVFDGGSLAAWAAGRNNKKAG